MEQSNSVEQILLRRLVRFRHRLGKSWLLVHTVSNEILCLLRGFASFYRTGRTPPEAYGSLISLHCRTQGYSTDILHSAIKYMHPKQNFSPPKGILGNWNSKTLSNFLTEVNSNGYFRFPVKLPESLCGELYDLASNATCDLYPLSSKRSEKYDSSSPHSTRYNLKEQDLLDNKVVQDLICDRSILTAAQAYLGCAPILDSVVSWWTTPYGQEANDDAAQLYHFDMDRVKWVKFFIYLTDVSADTGPHCFIAKSHRRGQQSPALLKRGYARIQDSEMAEHYPREHFIELTGQKGSIFAVDTRGFHKGKHPTKSHRLILELEFVDSLFGAVYARGQFRSHFQSALLNAQSSFPITYTKYDRI